MRAFLPLALLTVLACQQPRPAADCRDDDGDGYAGGPGCNADCDDSDSTIHPGAPELCNGRDDNCNGLVDEPNEPGGPSPCACVPRCASDGGAPRVCGNDGCTGKCGICPKNYVCLEEGICKCYGDCMGKQCGDDGCGGSCGTCDGGSCVNGRCGCQRDCAGRTCGDDGCGGSCGTCLTGSCVAGACVGCTSNCVNRNCGDDGCGKSCGQCTQGRCNLGGRCTTVGTTNVEAWRLAPFSGPDNMHSHSQADFESKSRVVIFGGRSDVTLLGDTWVLDYAAVTPAFTKLSISSGPAERSMAAMAFVAPSGPIVLAGGWTDICTYGCAWDTTWSFDGAAWTFLSDATYDPRLAASVAGAVAHPLVFGGWNEVGEGQYDLMSDGATFDSNDWTWFLPAAPGARFGAAMATYRSRGYALLFGGQNAQGYRLGDTWARNITTGEWTQVVAPRSPPARYRAALAEDLYNDVLVLFGGVDGYGTPLGDTWIWDGRTWTEVTGVSQTPAPRARAGISTARLKASTGTFVSPVVLLTGGHGASYEGYADAWIWGP